MNNLEEVFNAFYTRFILRDLCAKVTPGAVLLLVFTLALTAKPENLFPELKSLTLLHWVIIVPVCWLIGITIQGAGSFLPFFVFGKGIKKKVVWYPEWRKLYFNCAQSLQSTSPLRYELERIVVIREASGITFATLLFSFLLLKNGIIDFITAAATLKVVLLVSMFCSLSVHFSITRSQYDFMVEHKTGGNGT